MDAEYLTFEEFAQRRLAMGSSAWIAAQRRAMDLGVPGVTVVIDGKAYTSNRPRTSEVK